MIEITKLTGRMGNQMFQHAYLYSQAKKGILPDVYVQDPAYFENCKEEIKAIFGSGIGLDTRVGVQLRRGDYVDNPFYVNLSATNYYKKALSMFPKDRFLVFCKNGDPKQDIEDKEWCIEYFTNLIGADRFDFCDIEDPVEALNAFASCRDVIMANGSFSWWAAYLGNHKKTVIAPRDWYSDGVERTKCPLEWIKL